MCDLHQKNRRKFDDFLRYFLDWGLVNISLYIVAFAFDSFSFAPLLVHSPRLPLKHSHQDGTKLCDIEFCFLSQNRSDAFLSDFQVIIRPNDV